MGRGDKIFEIAIQTVLKHEGGYTVDHAGPTNYGVTLRSLDVDIDLDGDIDGDDIRAMTIEDAIAFYKRRWWDRYKYYEINHMLLATKVFDLAVNMGSKQAGKLVQRAMRAFDVRLVEDGVLGPVSFNAINNIPYRDGLIIGVRCEAAGFYRSLVAGKPKFEEFLKGWLNRAYA